MSSLGRRSRFADQRAIPILGRRPHSNLVEQRLCWEPGLEGPVTGLKRWIVLLLVALAALSFSMQGLASDTDFVDNQASRTLDNGDDDDAGDEDNEDDNDADNDEDDEDDEDDADEDEEDDEDDFETDEREVRITIDEEADEVTIELEREVEGQKDEVKIQFEAREAEMRVSFETENAQEEEVEMRVTIRRILEYENLDLDPAFNPLEDRVLQSFDLEELILLDLNQSAIMTTDGEGFRLNATYGFPVSNGGTFELVFWVFGVPTSLPNGALVAPSFAKIDFNVTEFPFGDAATNLSLELSLKTKFELEASTVAMGDIEASGERFAAFFRWDSMAQVGTPGGPLRDVLVGNTTVSNRTEVEVEVGEEGEFERELRLFLSYPKEPQIIHDPQLGILAIPRPLIEGFPLMAFSIGLGTALLLVGAASTLTRRRA